MAGKKWVSSCGLISRAYISISFYKSPVAKAKILLSALSIRKSKADEGRGVKEEFLHHGAEHINYFKSKSIAAEAYVQFQY